MLRMTSGSDSGRIWSDGSHVPTGAINATTSTFRAIQKNSPYSRGYRCRRVDCLGAAATIADWWHEYRTSKWARRRSRNPGKPLHWIANWYHRRFSCRSSARSSDSAAIWWAAFGTTKADGRLVGVAIPART